MINKFDLSSFSGDKKILFMKQLEDIIDNECQSQSCDLNGLKLFTCIYLLIIFYSVLELAYDCAKICLRESFGKEVFVNSKFVQNIMFAARTHDGDDKASVASIRCMINVLNNDSQAVRIFLDLNGLTWLVGILECGGSAVRMFYATRLFYMLICQRYNLFILHLVS